MNSKKQQTQCRWPRCPCKSTGQYCENKPASGPKPKKAIPKRNVNRTTKADIKKALWPTDMAFYMEIWEERPHVSFENNESILSPRTFTFHHVLEKDPYPEYRHCKWNIVLLTWEQHDQAHKNLDKLPKLKSYTEKLRRLHDAGLLKTKDPNLNILIDD